MNNSEHPATSGLNKWYFNPWFISLLCAGWLFVIPVIAGIVLLILRTIKAKKEEDLIQTLTNSVEELTRQIEEQKKTMEELGITEYQQAMKKIQENEALSEGRIRQAQSKLTQLNSQIESSTQKATNLTAAVEDLQKKEERATKSYATQQGKLSRIKEIYKSIDYSVKNYVETTDNPSNQINSILLDEAESLAPSVILKLHYMDVQELRKAFRDNDKSIDSLLQQYSSRYTTKSNKAIYSLMVIALRAELQNILSSLKYEKLDTAIDQIKNVSAKYLSIASDGNQTIAGTLTKFIGQLEYLFINSAKIEYTYYVKREQARQEQIALKEQMRQKEAEIKALEQEKVRVQKEETKFNTEITKLQENISSTTDSEEIKKLEARILELQSQLSDVIVKKKEIANLQNGKAGTVYIISNLGSFGDDVFKIGMTRRLDPQDRVNELGSASVPFKFDVHSFIFSKDAVALEGKMHELLRSKRVNKVNMRKEFFKVSIDELEKLVNEIEPTAEFCKTMAATEFRHSLLDDELNTEQYPLDMFSDEDED